MRPLGYGRFDEYKVMGLAPYGDPARFRCRDRLALHPGRQGPYEITFDRFKSLVGLVTLRRPGEPFTQGAQGSGRRHSGSPGDDGLSPDRGRARGDRGTPALSGGGVALNCTFNGKLAKAGWFDEIFVQPIATDAGARSVPPCMSRKTEGPPDAGPAHARLSRTAGRARGDRSETARLGRRPGIRRLRRHLRRGREELSAGAVLGWVQGRSEFGPRALGNRSIVADPRPAENKDRVNLMVKKREAYRPFAPSVLSEHAGEYFEIPDYPGGSPS
jgi:carbamoyltransferase